MLNTYNIFEYFSGFSIAILDLMVVVAFISGIFIIVAKNPIISVLFLILLFSDIACYLMIIGVKFIGISYLLVYVGAVSILFLFILMLINIRVSELISDTNNSIPLAALTVLAFFIPYSNLIPNVEIDDNATLHINNILKSTSDKNELLYVTSYNWDNKLVDVTDITSIGNIMYSSFSLWLIITSLILLLAMVGSIVITIKQKY